MRRSRGFTLMELLVVLVIIGIAVGFATIAFGDNRADELEREARRLAAVLALASDEAIVKSRPVGVRFDADGYRFYLRGLDDNWLALDVDREFAAHAVPAPIAMTLLTDARAVRTARDDEDENEQPHAYFLPTGELYPPFEVTLQRPDLAVRYRLQARIDGSIELDRSED